jgi:murein DD-endopeptidase MepM/ murein hydrolase activator NlpD
MRKLHIELPKYRLVLNLKMVKRRKSLFDEALIPTVSDVKKKYRKGSLVARYFRHVFEHKGIKRAISGGIIAVVIFTSFFPPKSSALAQGNSEEISLDTQTQLTTQKSIQLPVQTLKINQGFSLFHPALDLGGTLGDPIKPVKAGEVVEAGFENDGYGDTIVVDHGKGLTSRYAHLSKIEVKIGDVVTTNTEIGQMGKTGHATGPHLHLEIRQNGIPLNPLSVLPR